MLFSISGCDAAKKLANPLKKSKPVIIFVSPDGDDAADGSIDSPFATITRARDQIRTLKKQGLDRDVTVMLRGGIYYIDETIVLGLKDSATDGHMITYKAYPAEEPIISSGVEITGFKKLKKTPAALPKVAKGKVWVADVPQAKGDAWRFRTLYEGETMLPRARSKGFRPTEDGSIREKRWEVMDTLHFPEGTIKNWKNLEDVEILIRPNHQWLVNYLTLKSVDEKTNIAKTTINGTYRLAAVKNKPWKETCWVENVLEALDEPGEWVLNTQEGKLYLWPKNGKPENIYAPVLRELLLVEGKNVEALQGDKPATGIILDDITFTCGDRDVWTSEDKGIQHDWDMWDKDNAALRFRGVENCAVKNCTFRNTGGGAIRLDLYAKNCLIEGNEIHDIGGTAILLCGYGPGLKDVNKGHIVRENHIRRIAQLYWHSPAVFIWQSGDNKILNNYIHNIPYDGIVLSGVRPRYFDITDPVKWTQLGIIPKDLRENMLVIRWDEVGKPKTAAEVERFAHARNNLIQDNELHDVLLKLGDGNAIYLSCAGYNNIIRRNLTYHSPGAGNEIRFDDDQQESVIEDNIIFGGGITLKHRNKIENNIIVGYASHIVIKNETEEGASIEKNIIYRLEPPTERDSFYGPVRKDGSDIPVVARTKPDKNIFWLPKLSQAEDFVKRLQAAGLEKSSIAADPGFVDLQTGDVRLKADSPARKLGIKSIDITKIGLTKDPSYLRLKEQGFDKFYGPTGKIHEIQ
jgi:hypothetical protein